MEKKSFWTEKRRLREKDKTRKKEASQSENN
jgi:hypothetical protein